MRVVATGISTTGAVFREDRITEVSQQAITYRISEGHQVIIDPLGLTLSFVRLASELL